MRKNSRAAVAVPELTIGFDISDRTVAYCELNAAGEIVAEGTLKLTRVELWRYVSKKPAGTRIAMETGTHSHWIREEVEAAGHEAIVANARELAAVTGRSRRTDGQDARQLARLARVDPALLNPVELRRTLEQADLFVIRARAVLVEARTMLINFARAAAKTMGHRLPASSAHCFVERLREAIPDVLEPALQPLVAVLEALGEQLERYDEGIEELAEKQYPETRWLKQVPGVGTLTALTYVLTIGDPARFARSRDVGAFLGLVPRRRQSGQQDPHMPITKCGDRYLRKLLTQCSHVILGGHGADGALRRWGLAHAQQSRTSKKRAVTAVARKLAVLLHRLWSRQESYQPFPASSIAAAA